MNIKKEVKKQKKNIKKKITLFKKKCLPKSKFYFNIVSQKFRESISTLKNIIPRLFKIISIVLVLLILGTSIGLYYGIKNPPILDNWASILVDLENGDSRNQIYFQSLSYEEFSQKYFNLSIDTYNELISNLNQDIEYKTVYFSYTTKYILDNNCEKLDSTITNDSSNEDKCYEKTIYVNNILNNVWIFEELKLKNYDREKNYKKIERPNHNNNMYENFQIETNHRR